VRGRVVTELTSAQERNQRVKADDDRIRRRHALNIQFLFSRSEKDNIPRKPLTWLMTMNSTLMSQFTCSRAQRQLALFPSTPEENVCSRENKLILSRFKTLFICWHVFVLFSSIIIRKQIAMKCTLQAVIHFKFNIYPPASVHIRCLITIF